LSSLYLIKAGDTFESIARKVYGDDQKAWLIRQSNAGINEPLAVGWVLDIPDDPNAPKDLPPSVEPETIDSVVVLIGGQEFKSWESIKISRSIDSISTVSFDLPFDSSDLALRVAFRPFSYREIIVYIGQSGTVRRRVLFRGTIVDVNPSLTTTSRRLSVSAYAKCGVLTDCTPSAAAFPIQFENAGLTDIAATLAAPFGVGAKVTATQGDVFEQVTCEPDRKIFDFIADLARQRNLILSSNDEGDLLIWREIENQKPVAKLKQGEPPLTSIEGSFTPRDYFSTVTGVEQSTVGVEGEQFTATNERLRGVIRPFSFKVTDAAQGALRDAVYSKFGRMFANAASYSITVPTWRDSRGQLWEPNTVVNVFAPDAMIYREYDFLIRSVSFIRNADKNEAVLNLVMPGSFSGRVPDSLPWA
jgi:prophage tail gpP-like protein